MNDVHQKSVMVIGYGNTLRGDDGIGPLVARQVEAWAIPNIVVRVVHQLVPELAPELALVGMVVFVDACQVWHGDEVVGVQAIAPAETGLATGHTGDPRDLLALAATLYQRVPPAWWVTVPATQFAMGADLSAGAQARAAIALERVRGLIARFIQTNTMGGPHPQTPSPARGRGGRG